MAICKIKDIAEEISVRVNDPKSSGYQRFVGLEHYIPGNCIIRNFGSAERLDSAVKEFKSGDILIARRNVYLKRAGIVYFDGVTSGDSIVLRAKTKLMQGLLPFILNTDKFWSYANQNADGSMSKRLSPKLLMDFEFSLPENIDKNEELADILWKMESLREAYETQVKASDDLVKSQFIEMFETGEYPLTRIENVVDRNIIRANKKFSFDDEIEYLDISSIDNESMCVIGATKYLLKNAPSRAQYILEKGDILYSTVRPNLQNIAINPYDGDNIVGSTGFCVLRCRGVRPEYLWGVITGERFTKSMIALASGANYPAVTDKTVLGYEIPLPTDDEQMRFARLIEKTDKSKYNVKLAAAIILSKLVMLIGAHFYKKYVIIKSGGQVLCQ